MAGEGEFPKIGGDIAYATEANNARRSGGWTPEKFYGLKSITGTGEANPTNIGDIICHSATDWTFLDGTSTKVTDDAGVTWTDATTDAAECVFGTRCEAVKTKAIAFKGDNSDLNIYFTTNSGVDWTVATTDPVGLCRCISYVTDDVAVMGTSKEVGNARTIYYTSDGGVNWALCDTGPTGVVNCISMFNVTTGFAVVDGGAIWKTTNAGVDWTDTTHTMSDPFVGELRAQIFATSAATFIAYVQLTNTPPQVEYYGGSGNTTISFVIPQGNPITEQWIPFNIMKLTNGSFILGGLTKGTKDSECTLIKMDSYTDYSFYMREARVKMGWRSGEIDYGNNTWLSIIQEYDTNKFMIKTDYGYMLFNEG